MRPHSKLWKLIGRPLQKQDPDILIYSERMSPTMIRRIIERDYAITPTMLKKLEAIAKATKTDPLQVLWTIHRQAYIAGLGKASVEKTVNEYILRMTGNRKLLISVSTLASFNEKNNLTGWKPESPEKIAYEEREMVDAVAQTYPQFENMTLGESTATHDTIFNGFEDGKSVDQIAKQIERDTGVPFEHARIIVRTEESGITNALRLDRFQDRDPFGEFRYGWVGASDHRTTKICTNIKLRIKKEGKGKGVPLKRLLAIVEEESIKGNPPTWQYRQLIPHIQCRHSLVRVI
ncbi:MAG: phage minor head protein [Methanosarcinaceae archaeon]